jgi:hypothetical protein
MLYTTVCVLICCLLQLIEASRLKEASLTSEQSQLARERSMLDDEVLLLCSVIAQLEWFSSMIIVYSKQMKAFLRCCCYAVTGSKRQAFCTH